MHSPEKIANAKAVKWKRGDLKYLLHEGQRKVQRCFDESLGQLFVANVSRQFGKSFWAVAKCVEHALRNPKSRIKYGTAFQTDLQEFILPTFDAVLKDCPEHLKPVYKVQGSKWVFANKSEIKLVGLDKSPNSLRGNVIDLIVIDEAAFVANLDYIYRSIIMPATLHRPKCRIILISTPPATPAHPFTDFIQMAESKEAYIKLTIYENPRITQDDIDRLAVALGGYTSTSFRRECLCELILDEDLAIIPEWDDQYCQEVEKTEFYKFYHKYVGMDLGRKDHTALIFGYYDFKRAALVVEDELTMRGSTWTTETLKAEVLAKERELWQDQKPFRRISDNNNPHLIIDLSSLHNLVFAETNKESLEAMVNEVRMMVKAGSILIHPRCKMLLGCLRYGLWDDKRREFARSKIFGHFDHLAALIYLVRNLAKNSNPIPVDYGHFNHTSMILPQRQKSHNAQVLEKMLVRKGASILNT